MCWVGATITEADPGSVKRGGGGGGNPNSSMPHPKITKIGQKKHKIGPPKKGGPRPIRPPPPLDPPLYYIALAPVEMGPGILNIGARDSELTPN